MGPKLRIDRIHSPVEHDGREGSQAILQAVTNAYHIAPGETTEDGEISLLTARCLGSCSLAPAALMDENVIGNLTPERALAVLEGWTKP